VWRVGECGGLLSVECWWNDADRGNRIAPTENCPRQNFSPRELAQNPKVSVVTDRPLRA
jgi:hypothetical protein